MQLLFCAACGFARDAVRIHIFFIYELGLKFSFNYAGRSYV